MRTKQKHVTLKQKISDWAREADTRMDWATGFLFLIMFSIVGIFMVFMAINNYELINQVDTHSKGTVTLVIIFLIMFEIIGAVLKRSQVRDKTDSLDRWRIDYVYPADFVELITDEKDETAESYDPVLLEEAKWYGIETIEEIDMPEETLTEVLAQGNVNWDYLNKNWDTISPYKTTDPAKTKKDGYHLCLIKFDRYVRFMIKNPERIHKSKQILVASPVPIRDAIKLRRMKVPAGGWAVDHSHAERIKLIFKKIIMSDLPCYKLNDSAYFDNVDKETVIDDPTAFALGLVDTVTYTYKRLELKVEADLQALQDSAAEKDETLDLEKARQAEMVATFNVDDDMRRINWRLNPKKEEIAIFWFLTVIGWALFVLMYVLETFNII